MSLDIFAPLRDLGIDPAELDRGGLAVRTPITGATLGHLRDRKSVV